MNQGSKKTIGALLLSVLALSATPQLDAREFRARETRHGGVARARSSETAGATRDGGDGDARAG